MRMKILIVMLVVLTAGIAGVGTANGAEKSDLKKAWTISFLGTMPVPAQMEIVDIKDVLPEMIKFSPPVKDQALPQDNSTNNKGVSPEDLAAMFDKYNFGIYEFALQKNGTYYTAYIFAAKVPAEMNLIGLSFMNQLETATLLQQQGMQNVISQGINGVTAQDPNLQNSFQLEILEFYPFEHLSGNKTDIVGIGGSGAVRVCKLIQPVALKLYFINRNGELYVFGVVNSGPDRKMWEDMCKDMLNNAQWAS